ncbi:VPDSG-CTERM sorting domain-containing protein [Pelagicoccus sp. SDUM812005]|uniref:VPDSG-CTERM sorting domain-containing protein n=1 Tax=Pelagicoccus sp. SDUM812005 TaxID=3041257 RepID=UPI00280F9B46|nr:VPDSG-CTERM sorting domain-containing protein [Pelagicoccus sp. SDUM812005]MDQ8180791.1 VPDSG-CTERM sorting domain-containing protein [Pelagicoccus sp. SDUM812005]
MKTKLFTLSAVALAFLASQASAISFQYSDYRDADFVGKLLTNEVGIDQVDNSFASGVFDIVNDDGDIYTWDKYGFTPGAEVITAAEIGFGFYDLSQSTPNYLGDFRYLLGQGLSSLAGSLTSPGTTLFEFDLATAYMGNIAGDLILDLQDDGLLAWRVELDDSFQGEVTLYWAALAADAERVPDSGSTAALLGLSIFAGLVARRRMTA